MAKRSNIRYGRNRVTPRIILTDDDIKNIILTQHIKKENPHPELCDGPCWIYTGTIDPIGYAQLYIANDCGKRIRELLHRASYRIFSNDGKDFELMALHKCGVRACINFQHIYAGTDIDNYQDALAHGRNAFGRNA